MNSKPQPHEEERKRAETVGRPRWQGVRRVAVGGLVFFVAAAGSTVEAAPTASPFKSPTSSGTTITPKTVDSSNSAPSMAQANALVQQAGKQLEEKKPQEAVKTLQKAVALAPNYLTARLQLAMLLAEQDRCAEAVEQYRMVLYHNPDDPVALNNLADILASHPDEKLRDGKAARKMAERVCELTRRNSPVALSTLAAAYAEGNQYDRAVQTIREAIKQANKQNVPKLADLLKTQLDCYEREQPFRKRVSVMYVVTTSSPTNPNPSKDANSSSRAPDHQRQ